MKLLSVLLVLIFTTFALANDSFVLNIEGCTTTTFQLNQCISFCGLGHFKIVEITQFSYNYQGYIDAYCETLGNIENTDIPYVFPFSCDDGVTDYIYDGNTVTCHLENSGISAYSTKSISLAVLFAFALVLSLF